MKILGTPALPTAERMMRPGGRVVAEPTPTGGSEANVHIAGGARFVTEVKAAASTISEVRALEVIRAQEDVLSGQLLTDAEIEAAVDGLLAGL